MPFLALAAPLLNLIQGVEGAAKGVWHWGVEVKEAPARRKSLEERLGIDKKIVKASRDAVNLAYILYEEDRKDLEARFDALDIKIEGLRQYVSAFSSKVKGVHWVRLTWPCRQKSIEKELSAVDNDLKDINGLQAR